MTTSAPSLASSRRAQREIERLRATRFPPNAALLHQAQDERDLMRPVVEAACQWRDDEPPVGVFLQACVDAYCTARKAGG